MRSMIAPLAPALPPLGGAPIMPRYYPYKNLCIFYKQVIRHYRNRGAPAAGRSPWSVKYLSMISHENHTLIPSLDIIDRY